MRKKIILFGIDIVLLSCACVGAFVLQDGAGNIAACISSASIMLISASLFACMISGLYTWSFRLANMSEFFSIVRALILGSAIGYGVGRIVGGPTMHWRYVVLYVLVALCLLGCFRFSVRMYDVLRFGKVKGRKRVLIVGAGEAGEIIAKKMKQDPSFGYCPVAFVDDDVRKRGMRIRGLLIVGGSHLIPSVVTKYDVEEIIIAIPSAQGSAVRKVIGYCEKTKAKVKILPGVWEIIFGDASLHQIRDVQPEDLLGRKTVNIDLTALGRSFYAGKTVLVTGACGSIGKELVHQLEQCNVRQLIAVDRNENDMYFLHYRDGLVRQNDDPCEFVPLLADITNKEKMESIFMRYRPQIIFHAAAYKHVPLMESFPNEAVINNIEGTRILTELAHDYGVEHFALISTDKAVKPFNVMGYTKRMAELLVQANRKGTKTRFFAVRFGNVLGSNGSIVPILMQQIKKGGPVTVTDKKVRRYFMTISEAVQLILQAATLAEGHGEIFVLDMGEQVYIDDLAREMITLAGLVPDQDIRIEYVGMRPGEKMEEELFEEKEHCQKTPCDKILVVRSPHEFSIKELSISLDKLIKQAKNHGIPFTVDECKGLLTDILRKFSR